MTRGAKAAVAISLVVIVGVAAAFMFLVTTFLFHFSGGQSRMEPVVNYGALSVVGDTTGLCDATRSLWGFAVRSYADECVDLPTIVFWDEAPGRGLPGYGWVFPGGDGGVNLGLGIGMGANRRLSVGVTRRLPAFLAHLRALGLIGAPPPAPSRYPSFGSRQRYCPGLSKSPPSLP